MNASRRVCTSGGTADTEFQRGARGSTLRRGSARLMPIEVMNEGVREHVHRLRAGLGAVPGPVVPAHVFVGRTSARAVVGRHPGPGRSTDNHARRTVKLSWIACARALASERGDVQRWLVVNGQQRLTTLSLALAAGQDHVSETAAGSTDRLDDPHQVNRYQDVERARYLRLLPTQADRAANEDCIRRGHGHGTDRISVAYRFFRQRPVIADHPTDPPARRRADRAGHHDPAIAGGRYRGSG